MNHRTSFGPHDVDFLAYQCAKAFRLLKVLSSWNGEVNPD